MCSSGEQLEINQPHIYDCDIPESLVSVVPNMAALCKHRNGQKNSTVADASFSSPNRSVSLLSLAGTQFISFAKGASFKNGKIKTLAVTEKKKTIAVPEKIPGLLNSF